jgi:hypothetical protein
MDRHICTAIGSRGQLGFPVPLQCKRLIGTAVDRTYYLVRLRRNNTGMACAVTGRPRRYGGEAARSLLRVVGARPQPSPHFYFRLSIS